MTRGSVAKIKREDLEPLQEEVQSREILDCVDNIDHARTYLGDGENFRPPQIRTDLLKLHALAMSVINHVNTSKAQEFFDLSSDIESEISSLIEHLENVQEVLTKITNSAPDSLAD